jgi:phage terminase large subunit
MNNDCVNFDYPEKLTGFLQTKCPYQVLYGGRSSAKTYTALLKLVSRSLSYETAKIVLCTRETQNSMETSTYLDLKQIIETHKMGVYFLIQHNKIVVKHNGTEFIFKGLKRDINSIKSMPNIAACLVEEAETIGQPLWEVLDPTLRSNGVELIICFNPKDSQSYTYREFVLSTHYGDDIYRQEINYYDNPFNSPDILKKISRMRNHDYARYEHIYMGKVLDMSEDVIFKGRFKIDEVDIQRNTRNMWTYKGQAVAPLYGLDFGFSVDPIATVEIFMLDEDTVYISREIYETGLLITKLPQKIKAVMPEAIKDVFYADSASPDKIAQLNHEGIRCIGAAKGKGSIEAGVDWMLGKKFIIHPSCTNTIYEFYNYKYKVDKNSGKITRDIIDANNHAIDAIRYGCYKQISSTMRRPIQINKKILNRLGVN